MKTAMLARLAAIVALAICWWGGPAGAGWECTYEGPALSGFTTEWIVLSDDSYTVGYARVERYFQNQDDIPLDDPPSQDPPPDIYYCSKSSALINDTIGSVESKRVSVSIDGVKKWTWNWDGDDPPPSECNFSFDLRAVVTAEANMEMRSERGKGKFECYAYARLVADTANMDVVSNERHLWVGVQHIEHTGGLTGIGVGPFSGSIQWSDPDPQDLTPYMLRTEFVHIAGTDDDPGSVCFVEVHTAAATQVGEFEYAYRRENYSNANARLDYSYPLHKLQSPKPIVNP